MTQAGAHKREQDPRMTDGQALQDWREVTDIEAEHCARTCSTTATSWTLITDAINEDSGTSGRSKDLLVKRYWHAVFAFIRASG